MRTAFGWNGSALATVTLIVALRVAAMASDGAEAPLPAGSPPGAAPGGNAVRPIDCSKAGSPMTQAICGDATLTSLDRALVGAYAEAQGRWSEAQKAEQRGLQDDWIEDRSSCKHAKDPKPCLLWLYQHRLAEVRIRGGQLTPAPSVGYVCKGDPEATASVAVYDETEPKSALITVNEREVVVLEAPAKSGVRYTAAGVDFQEDHGKVTLLWFATPYECTAQSGDAKR